MSSVVADASPMMPKRPVAPLSEANLCRHTLQMSPVSRQARINHIIGYVDRQRELVSSDAEEEEIYRLMMEDASILRTGRASYRRNSVPSALDPSLALPRALPKSEVFLESDLAALDEHMKDFDSESPARRHTTDACEPSSNYKSKFAKLGAFAFLNRRRQAGRRGSFHMPTTTKSVESASIDSRDQVRFNSMTYRAGRALGIAALRTASDESQSDETKPKSTVKKMFMGAFRKASKASSESTKNGQLHPEMSFALHEKQLFAMWPQTADLDEDFQESSSSDQSPNTLRNPWTPELTPLSKLKNSPSFNRDLIGLDDDEEDNDSQTTLQSSQKIPIANLIRDLSTFGLDYIPSHKLAPLEQEPTNDFENAGLRYSCAVAAM
ncbi:hypothetical protein BGX34_010955 [Mortierella sp. NVP85]|nr:hypothetical protein BGX34_010955 [Mortierella sp. NVP85]